MVALFSFAWSLAYFLMHFVFLDYIREGHKYHCKLCPQARGTVDWRKHVATAAHKMKQAARLEHTHRRGHQSPVPSLPAKSQDQMEEDVHNDLVWNHIERFCPLARHEPLVNSLPTPEADLTAIEAVNKDEWNLACQQELLELDELDLSEDNLPLQDRPIIRTDKRSDRVNTSPWYPFKSKQVGGLFISL